MFLCAILIAPIPSLAKMYDAEYQQCNKDRSTLSIVDCVQNLTKQWDKRLNSSYKELMERSETAQQASLKSAQRLWIKYRDANCGFYSAGEGSISQIDAIECLRSMTQARTCELQAANNRGEGGPSAECDRP